MNKVMKQKIFSLLFLMLASVCTAWADTYTIKMSVDNYIHTPDYSNQTLAFTIPEANIETDVKARYEASYPQAEYTYTLEDLKLESSNTELAVSTGAIVISEPFNNTAYFSIKVTVQKGTDPAIELYPSIAVWMCHDTHTWSTSWEVSAYNAGNQHWHYCTNTNGQCPGVTDAELDDANMGARATHVMDDGATDYNYYTCSVCGYENPVRKSTLHVHHYASAWSENTAKTHHYHKCDASGTCTLDYDALTDEQKTATSYGEHTYAKGSYTCSVCGIDNAGRKADITSHEHSYTGDWQKNNDQHWKECSDKDEYYCSNPKLELANHTWGDTGDDRWKCQICDYVSNSRKTAIENADAAAKTLAWSWDYEIPFDFKATNITNDRLMNADQAYTVCLPYALKLNGAVKVYYFEQGSATLAGFKEQNITELPAFTPCVIIPTTTDNPLNMPSGNVKKTTDITDRKVISETEGGTGNNGILSLKGTLVYIAEGDAEGKFILQGKDATNPDGSFKRIKDDEGKYDNADIAKRYCILPMRAYIESTSSTPSRQLIGVKFYNADGSTTYVDRLVLDQNDNVVYDLQGRRVKNPRKGGLYIINGKKTIMK